RGADGSVTRQPASLVSDLPQPRSTLRVQIEALTERSISQTGAVLWLQLDSLTDEQLANEQAVVGAVSRLPDTITIVGHASATGRLRIADTTLEAAELAQLIRELPGYRPDQTVILLACDTATARQPSEASYAAALRTALDGNPVIGSRAKVRHHRHGRQGSGSFSVDDP